MSVYLALTLVLNLTLGKVSQLALVPGGVAYLSDGLGALYSFEFGKIVEVPANDLSACCDVVAFSNEVTKVFNVLGDEVLELRRDGYVTITKELISVCARYDCYVYSLTGYELTHLSFLEKVIAKPVWVEGALVVPLESGVKAFDLEGNELWELKVKPLALSSCANLLAVSDGSFVRLYKIMKKPVMLWSKPVVAEALAFSPDCRTLAIGGSDLEFVDASGQLLATVKLNVNALDWKDYLAVATGNSVLLMKVTTAVPTVTKTVTTTITKTVTLPNTITVVIVKKR